MLIEWTFDNEPKEPPQEWLEKMADLMLRLADDERSKRFDEREGRGGEFLRAA